MGRIFDAVCDIEQDMKSVTGALRYNAIAE